MLVFEKFQEYFSTGDPIVMTWFLIRDARIPFLILLVYNLFVIVIGPKIMANRKPIKMRWVLIVYNFALVAFYIQGVIRAINIFCMGDIQTFLCARFLFGKSEIANLSYPLGYEIYIIKYVELLDTVFAVLNKKFSMISPLHVIHHNLVPFFMLVYFRSETSSYGGIYGFVNGLVHIIMYSYYGVAVLGPQYKKYLWWKKYLTLVQISQFVFMAGFMMYVSAIGCVESYVTLIFACVMTFIFFWLFRNFYISTFKTAEINKNKDAIVQSGNGSKKAN